MQVEMSYAYWACVAIGAVFVYSFLAQIAHESWLIWKTRRWLAALRSNPTLAAASPWYRARMLVFLNPFSGTKQSRFIWSRIVEPVLRAHEVAITLVETTHAAHAVEFISAESTQLGDYDLCMLISGDGLLNEVLNALVRRLNPPHVLPSSPHFHASLSHILHMLPFALLPGGTSNGLVTSLYGHVDAFEVCKRIMHSKPRDMDILSVEMPVGRTNARGEFVDAQPGDDPIATEYAREVMRSTFEQGQKQPLFRVDVLTFMYGAVADCDHVVERTLRWMPAWLRLAVGPLVTLLGNETYPANVRLKPLHFTQEEQTKWHYTSPSILPHWSEADASWRVLRSDHFSSFVAMNLSHPGGDFFFAPSARPDDGALYACVIRKDISILAKALIFLQMGGGTHNANPNCEYFKVSEFVLYPATPRGHMSISGDPLPVQSLHGKVQPKAAYFAY